MVNLKIDVSEDVSGGRSEQDILAGIDFENWHFYPEQDDELKGALQGVVRRQIADAVRNVLVSGR